jgi:aspartyl-tRNA(Asn)/glutamyl-tRNA(Gln) amidotransferase subunit C
MKQEDVKHLAALARIELSPTEEESFTNEMSAILDYVSAVKDIAGDTNTEPQVGVRYNVFREDVVTNEPNSYTDALLAEMPKTDGRYMVVKKILTNPDA